MYYSKACFYQLWATLKHQPVNYAKQTTVTQSNGPCLFLLVLVKHEDTHT